MQSTKQSRTEKEQLALLEQSWTSFLDTYGTRYLLGDSFFETVGTEDVRGKKLLRRIATEAGCPDVPSFFRELAHALKTRDGYSIEPVTVGELPIPKLLLMETLKHLDVRSDTLFRVKTVEQLENITHTSVAPCEREEMNRVLQQYPVRLSTHAIHQSIISEQIGLQYLPHTQELNSEGFSDTWVGQFHKGIVEQMYQNRVIYVLHMECPVYCRFCFRKHKECRTQEAPTIEDVDRALRLTASDTRIKEAVLTGGECLMNRQTFTRAFEGLMQIQHIQTIRVATRCLSYFPQLFVMNDRFWLNYLKRGALELRERGAKLEIATHFIHPDEISIEALSLISDFVTNGIAVYVQTPLLHGCNEDGFEFKELFSKLRGAGAEMHYVFMPCSPIQGNQMYAAPIADGLNAACHARAEISDRAQPKFCTGTCIGKIDWHTSGWAVEQDTEDERFVWIQTPYTEEYVRGYAPEFKDHENVRMNSEGFLEARFMGSIGYEELFQGSDVTEKGLTKPKPSLKLQQKAAQKLYTHMSSASLLPALSIPTSALRRVHKTRAELCLDASKDTPDVTIEYLSQTPAITDVVVWASQDPITHAPGKLAQAIAALQEVETVHAVRVRSQDFCTNPEKYTFNLVYFLGQLNTLDVASPTRLEIESWFVSGTHITGAHARAVSALSHRGITVYNNTSLLRGANDSPEMISSLAYACREAGIEFHHCYVAGTSLQDSWNADNPISTPEVVAIATLVRQQGSGREVPHYIMATCVGEVDFGLASRFVGNQVVVHCYTQDYLRELGVDDDKITYTPIAQPIIPIVGFVHRGSLFTIST